MKAEQSVKSANCFNVTGEDSMHCKKALVRCNRIRENREVSVKRHIFGLFLILTLLLCLPSRGQQQESGSQPFSIKVNSRIVLLDVVVTDKKGNIVTDLKAGDFNIFEDNIPQRIRNFESPASHELPKNSGIIVRSTADLPKIGAAPVTILVLDELNTSFEDMAYARNRIEKYLNAQPPNLTQPTTLLAATNTRFDVVKDFTQDRAALLVALNKHFPEFPWKMRKSGANGSGAFERMSLSLNSLYQMAEATRGTPGRKTVIWVGKGFPSVNLLTLDDSSTALLQDAIKRLTTSLLQSRITLYTIDPASTLSSVGSIATSEDLEEYESRSDGEPFADEVKFSTLAPATGGRAFFSRNDIDTEVATSVADGANYYTLSYAPTSSSEENAKYRQIRIKMINPNLLASTRDGYYAHASSSSTNKTAEDAPKNTREELEAELGKAALGSLVYNGLTASLEHGTDNHLKLGVISGGLAWTDLYGGKLQAEVTVLQVAFSAKGKILAHSSQELSAVVDVKHPDEKVVFLLPAQIPPGTSRIRVVVRDALTGKIGTVDLNL